METKKLIIIIVVLVMSLLFVSFGICWFYDNIHYPAYLSTKASCGNWTEEYINELGYMTAGSFNVNEEIYIEILINDSEVIKHELCHQQQYEQGRLFSCKIPLLIYINEIECYIKQKL